jgi:hypothetical protein
MRVVSGLSFRKAGLAVEQPFAFAHVTVYSIFPTQSRQVDYQKCTQVWKIVVFRQIPEDLHPLSILRIMVHVMAQADPRIAGRGSTPKLRSHGDGRDEPSVFGGIPGGDRLGPRRGPRLIHT